MSKRLTDEELNAIEGQCDGFSMLLLSPGAQRDVRAMLAEIKERRAADLAPAEREALSELRQAATSIRPRFGDEHVAVLDRLIRGGK